MVSPEFLCVARCAQLAVASNTSPLYCCFSPVLVDNENLLQRRIPNIPKSPDVKPLNV